MYTVFVLMLGGAVFVAAIILLIVMAVRRARMSDEQKGLQRYACPRCGYAPTAQDVEQGVGTQCPICGQIVYQR